MSNKPGYEIPFWLILLCFVFGLWPVGLVLLILNANNVRIPAATVDKARRQADSVRQKAQADLPPLHRSGEKLRRFRKSPKESKLMTFLGCGGLYASSVALVGELSSFGFAYPEDWFPLVGLVLGSLTLAITGYRRTRSARRQKLYLGAIGQRSSVYLSDLAGTAGVKESVVIADLQRMLADGILPAGFIDRASGRLVLTDKGYQPPEAEAPAPESKQPEQPAPEEDDDAILREIRAVNDAIPDEEMSRKIDRIGDITGKILAYQRQNPEKAGQLRQFLSYYLPTTLKLLRAYAQLEAQGVEGENITAAKERIETMMDKVVAGFEKQLDQLFQNDALDIASDVQVLEQMLEKDGLGQGMTLGGS